MNRNGVAALALALLAWPGAGDAADVLDWAPEETQVAFVFRGADALADLVDHVDARFGQVPGVARAVRGLREWKAGSARPAARSWGPGLAPARGIGFFVHARDAGRFVVGADDPVQALQTLAAGLRAFDVQAEAAPPGLVVAGSPLHCAGRDGFLVCERVEPPAKAPGRPSWAKAPRVDADGLLAVFLRSEALQEVTGGAPLFHDLWISARKLDDVFEVVLDMNSGPMLADIMGVLATKPGPVKILEHVDQTSPATFKISLDPHALFGFLERNAGGPSEGSLRVWEAVRNHWSGDLVVTSDGGLMHPVVILGLTTAAGGEAWVHALADAATGPDVAVEPFDHPTRPGLRSLRLRAGEVEVHVPYAVTGEALVFAASPADVERRLRGRVHPAPDADALFTERGTHGVRLVGPPIGVFPPWIGEMVQATGPLAPLFDVQVVMGVVGELFDEAGFWMRARGDGLRARLWWRSL